MAEFWEKEFRCQYCGNIFYQTRFFSSAIMIDSRDSDLKPNYKGVNALYFQTVTCPHCYLTLFERDFGSLKMPEEKRPAVAKVLDNAKKEFGKLNFWRDKSVDDAVKQMSIAAAVYTVLNHRRNAAEAYLKLGWLFREKGDKKEELIALAKALKFFEEHYREEITKEEEEPMILFYLGELNARLGNEKEAVKWFSTLVSKYRGTSSLYVKAAKERWQEIRGS